MKSILIKTVVRLAVSHLICCEAQESNLVSSAYETEMIIRFTRPQYINKNILIAPPVPDFVFRITVYVPVFQEKNVLYTSKD